MSRITGIAGRGIYTDLMRKFRDEGHDIFIVSPRERSLGLPIEKGIGHVLVEGQYKRVIKKYLCGEKFNLILYSTPPITFPKVIKYLKDKNPGAKSYLLLKDILPQNAVDIGMMSKAGLKGVLYNYFRRKEKKLYALSDHIGCMSPANVEYVLKHNPEVSSQKVEIAPNSYDVDIERSSGDTTDMKAIREKYGLPMERPVFIYGGNLGKPQGIPFVSVRTLDLAGFG